MKKTAQNGHCSLPSVSFSPKILLPPFAVLFVTAMTDIALWGVLFLAAVFLGVVTGLILFRIFK